MRIRKLRLKNGKLENSWCYSGVVKIYALVHICKHPRKIKIGTDIAMFNDKIKLLLLKGLVCFSQG